MTEEFRRPTAEERRELFVLDLAGLDLTPNQIAKLVAATGGGDGEPDWTFSDMRTRLYPASLAKAYPDGPLCFEHLIETAGSMRASPVLEDRS
jgi:hypothetical protein